MESVPMPQILDPDRMRLPDREDMTIDEHRDRAARFHDELRVTCDYGQGLWTKLTEVREYLAEHTPAARADDSEWASWSALYGSVTASLASANGDNGFGAQEAELIEQERRSTG